MTSERLESLKSQREVAEKRLARCQRHRDRHGIAQFEKRIKQIDAGIAEEAERLAGVEKANDEATQSPDDAPSADLEAFESEINSDEVPESKSRGKKGGRK